VGKQNQVLITDTCNLCASTANNVGKRNQVLITDTCNLCALTGLPTRATHVLQLVRVDYRHVQPMCFNWCRTGGTWRKEPTFPGDPFSIAVGPSCLTEGVPCILQVLLPGKRRKSSKGGKVDASGREEGQGDNRVEKAGVGGTHSGVGDAGGGTAFRIVLLQEGSVVVDEHVVLPEVAQQCGTHVHEEGERLQDREVGEGEGEGKGEGDVQAKRVTAEITSEGMILFRCVGCMAKNLNTL